MSYSFDFIEPNVASAKARVRHEMAEVVRMQPPHAKDHDAAIAVADTFIDMLAEDVDMAIRVTMHGALGWKYDADHPYGNEPHTHFTNASIGASAWHEPMSNVKVKETTNADNNE